MSALSNYASRICRVFFYKVGLDILHVVDDDHENVMHVQVLLRKALSRSLYCNDQLRPTLYSKKTLLHANIKRQQ